MFAESQLNQIKERVSIVELIGEYIQLRKSGTGFVGLCPFHKEKTPSFHVHPLKQIFHCFGCHKGGNIFSFLMEIDGLKFPEAVERLAKRAGVTLEQVRKAWPTPILAPQQERLFAANELAAKYFEHLLQQPDYRGALDYLKGRGLSEKTIRKFRLGASPRGWTGLMTVLSQRGFRFQEMVDAGLVIAKEGRTDEGYDRFRERVMFPIRDPEGRVLGFGARLLKEEPRKDGSPQPKYINSPESSLFAKRRVLYGFFENQRGVRRRDEAIIVEGYMDVVGLFEKGVDNALATMGTALTEEHCQELKRSTRHLVTVFDPDTAGTEAYRRSIHVLMAQGMFARDLTLPQGLDPDEYVLQHSAEAFYELCNKAPRQVTKLLKELASRGTLSEQQTAKALEALTPLLVASRNLADRVLLWDTLSLTLGVPQSALKAIAEGAAGRKPGATANPSPKPPPRAPAAPPLRSEIDPLVLDFFKACLASPQLFLKTPLSQWQHLLPEGPLKACLETLHRAVSIGEFDDLLENWVHGTPAEAQVVSLISARLLDPASFSQRWGPEAFEAVLERLEAKARDREIRLLSKQVRLTQRLGDEAALFPLLERLKELRASSERTKSVNDKK